MPQNFLILVPRRHQDQHPETLLLQQLGKYGDITRTSDWLSLFNFASINAYTAIFVSVAAYAEEAGDWIRDLRRLHPHQVLILFSKSPVFNVQLVRETTRIFGLLDLNRIETSLAELMTRLEKYQQFRTSLGGKVSRSLLRPGGFGEFVGNAESMLDVYRQMTRVAASDYTVLIQGESGSGKELVARTIHQLSPRAAKPFVGINCAAIPENLLESELFGYDKGAFTGAVQNKAGKFELAQGGTLFLDEIGDMPLGLQVKLLRVLEDKKIQPLGSIRETVIDLRLVTATHRDLNALIGQGSFREDLHYRLNVIPLTLPPLRERRSDLLLLVFNILEKLLRGEDQSIRQVSWGFVEALSKYPFKGNIRELENVLTRSVIATEGDLLDVTALPAHPMAAVEDGEINGIVQDKGVIQPLWQVEKQQLQRALTLLDGNISQVAAKLEISRTAIYRKIKKYHLAVDLKDDDPGDTETGDA